ncbi:hypothetical protein [Modicisalibacter xianhensis]|uniref:Uncharacterized protein n=1 Tax=Modicisalibacter xianhensis TaxID=442341 RepID=A0A1I2YPD3_9GAMM|nr:hypothetical protein [Halomonas xianhensis]SFH27513.1 hypothetical protein SAMN04487959_10264 [Halomonas xianhensis]
MLATFAIDPRVDRAKAGFERVHAMLSILIYVLIYAGVTLALYQVYDIHYNLNFDDEDTRSRTENEELEALSREAKAYEETGESAGFVQAAHRIFGRSFDYRIALVAFREGTQKTYAEPLLRRKRHVVSDGGLKVRHLASWTTRPPGNDIRGVLLPVIIVNCLLVLFLGGLSVYTIAYEVPMEALQWANDEFILMVIIGVLLLMNFAISKFDIYMHDLYQLGKLSERLRTTGTF